MRSFILLIILLSSFVCNAQPRIDSLVRNFLTTKHFENNLVYKITIQKNKKIIERNYYYHKELCSPLKDGDTIKVFSFGSNSEHGDKYILIDYLSAKNNHLDQFYGYLGINDDLEKLVSFFKLKESIGLNDELKKRIVKIILNAY